MSSPKMDESVELDQDLEVFVSGPGFDEMWWCVLRDMKIYTWADAIKKTYALEDGFHLTHQGQVLNMNDRFSAYNIGDGDRIVVHVKGTGKITGIPSSPSLVPIVPTPSPSQIPAPVQGPAPINKFSYLFRVSNQNLTAQSFTCLAPGGWLDDMVVDIWMRRIFLQSNSNPTKYLLPNSFIQVIVGSGLTENSGVFPQRFDPSTSTLYMATFIRNHWVLTVIDFPSLTITIYDSSPGLHDLSTFITRLRDLLFEKTLVPQDSWTIADGICQAQEDGWNCGLWVLKNFECLLKGGHPKDLNLDMDEIDRFRTEIFNVIFVNKPQLGVQVFEAFENFRTMDDVFREAQRIANLDPPSNPPINSTTPKLQPGDFIVPATTSYTGPLLKKAQELDAKYRKKDNLSLDSLKKAQITTSGRPQITVFFPSPYFGGNLVLKDMLVQTSVTSLPDMDRYYWEYTLTPAQQLTMNVVDKPLTTKDKSNKVHYVSSRVICGVCFPRFLHQTAMKKVISLEKKHGCLTTLAIFHRHFKEQHGTAADRPNKCQEPGCKMQFVAQSDLDYHHSRVHIVGRPFVCSVCDTTYKHVANLKDHLKLHSDPDNWEYFCRNCPCPEKFPTFWRRMNHEIRGCKHDTGRTMKMCLECFGTFNTTAELKLHLRDVHQEPQHLCELCSRTFNSKSHLTRHKEGHKYLPYCGFCEVEFQTKDELKSHTFNDATHSKKLEIALKNKPFPHFKKADDGLFFDKITPFFEDFQGQIYKRCRIDSCRVCDHSIGVSQIRYQDLILKTELGGTPVSCDTMRAGIYLCLFQHKENQGDPDYMKRPDYSYSTSKYEEEPKEDEEQDVEFEFQKEVEEDVKKLQSESDYLGAYGGQVQCGYRRRMREHLTGRDGKRVRERFLNENLIKILIPIWSTTPSLLVDYCERHLIRTANLQDYWAGNVNVLAGGRLGFQYDD